MRLIRLQLVNYKQHTNTDINFTGLLVGIIGQNGSGKSHFLEAILFALTGTFSGNREDLLTWGSNSGYVRLTFAHNNREYMVHRDLNKASASLYQDKEELATGISKVNEALENLLDVDKTLYKQIVFAPQAELDAVLFTNPQQRYLTFQKLVGLGDTKKIHEQLKDIINLNTVKYNYEDQIKESEAKRDELKKQIEELTAELNELKPVNTSDLLDERFNISYKIKVIKQKQAMAEKLQCLKEQLNVAVTQQDVEAFDTKIAEIETDLSQIKSDIDTFDTITSIVQELEKLDVERGKVLKAIADINENYGGYTSKLKELEKSLTEFEAKRNIFTNTLNLVTDSPDNKSIPECPVCGHSLDSIQDLSVRLNPKIEDLNTQIKNITDNISSARLKQREAQDNLAIMQGQLSSLDVKIGTLKEKLKEYPKVPEIDRDDTVLLYQTKYNELEELKNKRNNIVEQLNQVNELKITYNSLLKQYEELEDYGIDTQKLEKEYNDIDKQIQEYEQIAAKRHRLEGQIQGLKGVFNNLENTLETLKSQQEGIKDKIQAIETLTRVKDWFHYSNGPKELVSTYMAVLAQDINEFLESFSAKFRVLEDLDNLTFRIVYLDDREQPEVPPPASVLSGGERIVLAVAFRLVNYRLFADKLGILSLDEPTVYLDSNNITNFCQSVEKLQTIAKNMKLQILMATHESSVIPYFDQVINFN